MNCLHLGRRASVSAELALVSVFFLLPLFAGGADLVEIISAQAQANTALRALYSFAWANPGYANTASYLTDITTEISSSSINRVKFSPTGTINVLNADGVTNTAVTSGTLFYECFLASAATTSSNYFTSTTAAPCTTAGNTVQTWVAYQVTSRVSLPVPLPYLTTDGHFTVRASGAVPITSAIVQPSS